MGSGNSYSSSLIFPVFSNNENPLDKRFIKIGVHALSNLPLQVSLHFNLIFFPFWLIVYANMIPMKFSNLTGLYQFILILAFTAITVIECLRLYIGYKGNLRERVSKLAGFWLVTILLQTPLQAFLLFFSGLKPSLLERIVQSIMCLFLFSQLIFGIIALRNSAKQSALTFHLSNSQYQGSQEDGKPSS